MSDGEKEGRWFARDTIGGKACEEIKRRRRPRKLRFLDENWHIGWT